MKDLQPIFTHDAKKTSLHDKLTFLLIFLHNEEYVAHCF
jgi:hypothetical protein